MPSESHITSSKFSCNKTAGLCVLGSIIDGRSVPCYFQASCCSYFDADSSWYSRKVPDLCEACGGFTSIQGAGGTGQDSCGRWCVQGVGRCWVRSWQVDGAEVILSHPEPCTPGASGHIDWSKCSLHMKCVSGHGDHWETPALSLNIAWNACTLLICLTCAVCLLGLVGISKFQSCEARRCPLWELAVAYAKSTSIVLAFDPEICDQSQAEFLRFCPSECNPARHVTSNLMGGGSWQPVCLKRSISACLKPSLRAASVLQMQSAWLKSLQSWEDVSLVHAVLAHFQV